MGRGAIKQERIEKESECNEREGPKWGEGKEPEVEREREVKSREESERERGN